MGRIRVGTCGYRFYDAGEDWPNRYESKLQAYTDAFSVGELNRTFYTLPQVSTAERWRREAMEGFEFTVKAWQALTHSWASPTWNNHRDAVPDDRTDEVGLLRPTGFNREAWARTRAIADALEAAVVVVQTPPSFDCTEDHIADMREFLGSIDRGGLTLAWEPRGDWADHPERIETICDDLDLVHVVDLLRAEPVTTDDVAYTRLHGLNDDLYDYDYNYSDAELDALTGRLRSLADDHERVYCLFNNYEMHDNAQALTGRLDR